MTSDSEDYGEWQIHAKSVCSGFCPFHNPSDHPLKDAPIHIRGDKMMLVERICEHGIGHDDPDSVAYFHSKGEMWAGIHGCDGCCGTKVSEDGSSTDDHANTEVSRELAPKAQSEAPSVDSQIDEAFDWLLASYIDTDDAYMIEEMEEDRPIFRAKINRLIDDTRKTAYRRGYQAGHAAGKNNSVKGVSRKDFPEIQRKRELWLKKQR